MTGPDESFDPDAGDDHVDAVDLESPRPRPQDVGQPPDRPGIPWRLGLFLVLMVLVVVFAIQNTQEVELKFLAWSWQLPLVVIILATMVVSVVLDEVLGGIIKRQRQRRRLEREELKRLRQNG